MDLVKTGIPGLDDILGGGIPFGSIVTVGGETGTGKTTLALQYLYSGITEYEEPGLFISFDERKSFFYSNMKKYGWDLLKLEREKKFLFIEFPPYEVEQFITQEEVVHEFIDELGIERLVIDQITPFALAYEKEHEQREAMQKLFEKFRKWLCTTIVLGDGIQVPGSTPKTKYGAEKLSDGFIFLYSIMRAKERLKGIEVIKMRGMKHENKVFELELSDRGAFVHPKKIIEI